MSRQRLIDVSYYTASYSVLDLLDGTIVSAVNDSEQTVKTPGAAIDLVLLGPLEEVTLLALGLASATQAHPVGHLDVSDSAKTLRIEPQ